MTASSTKPKRSRRIFWSVTAGILAGLLLLTALLGGAGYYIFIYEPALPATPGKVTLRYYVHGMALSPDHTRIAVLHGVNDESPFVHSALQVFDTASGKELWHVKGIPFYNGGVSFSPDGKTVASMNDLYDGGTGGKIRELDATKTHINSVKFLPNLKTAVGTGLEPALMVYDLPTGASKRIAIDPQVPTSPYANRATLSPDGKILALCGEHGKIHLWNTATWTSARDFTIGVEFPHFVKFSPDGTELVCAGHEAASLLGRCETRIFEIGTGASVFQNDDFTEFGTIAGGNLFVHRGKSVTVYDVTTGRLLGKLPTGQDMAFGLEVSGDQTMLAVAGRIDLGQRSEVQLWDIKTKLATLRPAVGP
jgi:WD40 repeat protein